MAEVRHDNPSTAREYRPPGLLNKVSIAVGSSLMVLTELRGGVYDGGNRLMERDTIPEPFDFPDHIGNSLWSFASGVAIANVVYAHNTVKMKKEDEGTLRKKIAVAVGGSTVAVNALAETVGYRFLTGTTTADAIDVGYGVLGGGLAYLAMRPRNDKKEEMKKIVDSTGNVTDSSVAVANISGKKPHPVSRKKQNRRRRRKKAA